MPWHPLETKISLEWCGDDVACSGEDLVRQTNEGNAERTDPVRRQNAAAMWDANKYDPGHPGIRVEDQCPFDDIIRWQPGMEPVRVAPEHAVPKDALGRYRLHLGKQPTQTVANQDHVLCFGIESVYL